MRNEFSWSHSRHETFRDCPRRYYYHYYGSWGGWAPDAEPRVRRLYVLKNLKARQLWAGGVVHDAVADALRGARAGPAVAPQTAEAAAEAAVARMRREFRESRDGAYLQRPNKALGLLEHHYRESVSDEQWREVAATVREAVLRFHRAAYLDEARALPATAWLALEDLATFPLDAVPVYVKIDFAVRAPGDRVTIVDWKTGRRDPKPEGLQLAVYALYAESTWGVAPESIEVREVNLSTGAEGKAPLSAAPLAAARETIRRSVGGMRALLADAAENRGREEDFATRPGPRTCPRCPFREICPETHPA
jgi:hypothetical protein